jgi:hypothetical protein
MTFWDFLASFAFGFYAGMMLALWLASNRATETADQHCREAGYLSGVYQWGQGAVCLESPAVKKVLP